jgi:hypothetical protein
MADFVHPEACGDTNTAQIEQHTSRKIMLENSQNHHMSVVLK